MGMSNEWRGKEIVVEVFIVLVVSSTHSPIPCSILLYNRSSPMSAKSLQSQASSRRRYDYRYITRQRGGWTSHRKVHTYLVILSHYCMLFLRLLCSVRSSHGECEFCYFFEKIWKSFFILWGFDGVSPMKSLEPHKRRKMYIYFRMLYFDLVRIIQQKDFRSRWFC